MDRDTWKADYAHAKKRLFLWLGLAVAGVLFYYLSLTLPWVVNFSSNGSPPVGRVASKYLEFATAGMDFAGAICLLCACFFLFFAVIEFHDLRRLRRERLSA